MKLQQEAAQESTGARGYTLIEMVTVMVIMSVIGLVVSFVIIESTKVYARSVPAMDASYKANFALARIKHDLRNMGSTGSISAMNSTALSFMDSSGNAINYALNGTSLDRNGDALVVGVVSLVFRYWQANGSLASSASAVHLIEVDLSVQTGSQPYRLQAVAFPRVLTP